MWAALQHAEWVTTVAESRPLYGLVLVVHYLAVFVGVGATVLVDLRILGLADRSHRLSALARDLRPWMWSGFAAVVISGFLLFAAEAGDYAAAAPFRVKMLVVLTAVISALAIEWNLHTWEGAPAMPLAARLVAVLSIVLWLGAVLVSVEIPALTGLG